MLHLEPHGGPVSGDGVGDHDSFSVVGIGGRVAGDKVVVGDESGPRSRSGARWMMGLDARRRIARFLRGSKVPKQGTDGIGGNVEVVCHSYRYGLEAPANIRRNNASAIGVCPDNVDDRGTGERRGNEDPPCPTRRPRHQHWALDCSRIGRYLRRAPSRTWKWSIRPYRQ